MLVIALLLSSCSVFQKKLQANTSLTGINPIVKSDTIKKTSVDSSKANRPKPYKDVITLKAITKLGLFTVHRIDERYFFEIPDAILDKDILLVTRISKGAAGVKPSNIGYSGDEIGEDEILFQKGSNNKLYIKRLSYLERSTDSTENGLFRTVHESNLMPIVASFDIKAFSTDSSSLVIDVTDFLNSDNGMFYFNNDTKKFFEIGGWQKDKSYVENIRTFPINVELQTINTYLLREQPVTFELNTSFVLLPEHPMKPRYYDERVGYFSRQYRDYDLPTGVNVASMITRWRLEPKDGEEKSYLDGKLVEPKKPIVYYIDPATPKKWVPYLIQGVNDWQQAFEKAGFKNAIYAIEPPSNDSNFSLFDARHNVIIYKGSPVLNASGPNVHDPRTGEILETHINWYHNVQKLLHDWYMIQAGPNDPRARKMVFHDSLMGQLIRFVCCHEVGHTLGLAHNFGASSTVPVDSLRSKNYVDKNGFCPSIMDYARFNYVAQPEDHFGEKELLPRLGVYDKWAIDWGYRWLPQLKSRDEEKAYMNRWIISSLEKDKGLWYGPQGGFIVTDPRCQSEDLGDDAMKASYYGIKNLKYVMQNLSEWTIMPNENFESMSRMQRQVFEQYERYIMHVANNIGNKYSTEKKQGQTGPVVAFISKEQQKRAVKFLGEQLFDPPTWLYDKKIFSLVGGGGDWSYLEPQRYVIKWLVSLSNYEIMTFAQMQQPEDAYSFDEFLTDFEYEIYKELSMSSPININFARRNLQKLYVERLLEYGVPLTSPDRNETLTCDYHPIFRKHMQAIVKKIDNALPRYKDEISKQHLLEIRNRLNQALNVGRFPSYFPGMQSFNNKPSNVMPVIKDWWLHPFLSNENNNQNNCDYLDCCWEKNFERLLSGKE